MRKHTFLRFILVNMKIWQLNIKIWQDDIKIWQVNIIWQVMTEIYHHTHHLFPFFAKTLANNPLPLYSPFPSIILYMPDSNLFCEPFIIFIPALSKESSGINQIV